MASNGFKKCSWSESQNINKETHGFMSKHTYGSLLFMNHKKRPSTASLCFFKYLSSNVNLMFICEIF
jgi:hypothetical protein